jgi:hypothetical protein
MSQPKECVIATEQVVLELIGRGARKGGAGDGFMSAQLARAEKVSSCEHRFQGQGRVWKCNHPLASGITCPISILLS